MTKKQTTKGKIVDAAWDLFLKKGYEETTIEDIVALSGTSKGTFYHYFNGKDSLLSSLSEIFDSYYEELYPTLDPHMHAVDKLIELSYKAHQMIGERIQLNLLASLYASQVITRGDKHLLDQNRYYFRMVQEVAEAGLRSGQIRQDMTVSEVVRYFSMCERSLVYDYCISNGSYDLGEYTLKLLPTMLAGIRGAN